MRTHGNEARAASAYERWVGSEGLSFRGRDDALIKAIRERRRKAFRVPPFAHHRLRVFRKVH